MSRYHNGDISGIPTDLEQQASDRFDELLSEGQMQWQPMIAENAEDHGFKVQFQTAPHLLLKPINPIRSPPKSKGQNHNDPFANPDPVWVVARPGPEHTLILNKFPVYKDSLVLHTNEFRSQSDDLDETDLAACWDTLTTLNSKHSEKDSKQRQWVMIYNCGIDAGSSQGHKHMQIWPVPSATELGFELFPGRVKKSTDVISLADVPFKHYILRLPTDAKLSDIRRAYAKLLREINECHESHGSTAYNVAMTREWLMLVPRRTSGGSLGAGGNTAVVLGLLWVNGAKEKRIWEEHGVWEYLARLGVPADA